VRANAIGRNCTLTGDGSRVCRRTWRGAVWLPLRLLPASPDAPQAFRASHHPRSDECCPRVGDQQVSVVANCPTQAGSDDEKMDDGPGLGIVRGYQPAAVLAAAADLDLFSALAGKPVTARALSRRTRSDLRGLTILLDALTALQLLAKAGDRYGLAPGVETFLTAGRITQRSGDDPASRQLSAAVDAAGPGDSYRSAGEALTQRAWRIG